MIKLKKARRDLGFFFDGYFRVNIELNPIHTAIALPMMTTAAMLSAFFISIPRY